MPPLRSSPGTSPHRPTPLSSIPFKFRRKSFSDDDGLDPHTALLLPPSPSLSPSLSMSMSSSPPSSPTALSTSPTRPSHFDTAIVRQPSSPLRAAAPHTYGYAYGYARAGSHSLGYGPDLVSAELHRQKPFPSTPHAYAVIPSPLTTSTRSVYSSLSPAAPDPYSHFYASASDKSSHHGDDDDALDIEDACGFALDMDSILGVSSPSRRVSFTTSSERDRPFVRPSQPKRAPAPVSAKPRCARQPQPQARAKTTPPPVTSDNPRTTTGSGTSAALPLPRETPRRPSTPVRPRTPMRARSAHPLVPATAMEDLDDVLPPSSPLSSPMSSPVKDREREEDGALPPSSPIPIPRSPASSRAPVAEEEFDLVPSPPSPTLDALRITSRVSVRALLNPLPEPEAESKPESVPRPVRATEAEAVMSETVILEVEAGMPEEVEKEEVEETVKMATDGDVTPFILGEAGETTIVAAEADIVDVLPEISVRPAAVASSAPSRLPSLVPSRVPSLAPSRMPSVVRSREVTPEIDAPQDIPEIDAPQDIPSSPLSSPPRSLADENDVAIDIDVDVEVEVKDELLAAPIMVASPNAPASRAPSVARAASVRDDDRAREPPKKKARREVDGDVAAARSGPEPVPAKKLKQPRARTRVESESESEGEASSSEAREAAAALSAEKQGPKPEPNPNPNPTPRTKFTQTQKKRLRVVWSDDETESEEDVPGPALALAPAQPQAPARKKKEKGGEEGERKQKQKPKAKKARTKENSSGDVENEPLEGSASNRKPRPGAKPGTRAAAPKSTTNIAHPRMASPVESGSETHGRAGEQESKSASEPERQAQPGGKAKTSLDAPLSPKKVARQDQLLPAYTLPLPVGELEGMLIETLATARASSLATSALYGALMAARPALREMALPVLADRESAERVAKELEKEREKEEKAREEGEKKGKAGGRGRGARADADAASRRAWVPALEGVLEAGWRRSGVFGKVVNCGTDTGDQELALEARWFYDPERDEDGERAALVRSMMRRPGKRNETKKAKQYYWRPLPKISRWDPEDEL